MLLHAKGTAFSIASLLADKKDAARLAGGPYLVVYLSPQDYHRVHSPVTGKIVAWVHVPGSLFPVGPRSVQREPGLFAKNERFIIHIATSHGLCSVVMVAAVGVGHITTSFDATVATHHPNFNSQRTILRCELAHPISILQGEELGIFNLGSTTITIFEPDRVMLHPLPPNSRVLVGTEVGRIQ
jgi:phosphatidylserine decarboxylase